MNLPIPASNSLPSIINLLLEDPTTPAMFTVSSPIVTEGENGIFNIILAEPNNQNTQINCRTQNGTASSIDFEILDSINLFFQPNETEKTISFSTRTDFSDFGEKQFSLLCQQIGSNESASGVATINYKSNIKFSSNTLSQIIVNEGESIELELIAEGNISAPTTITYQIISNNAENGVDYIDNTNGTVTFLPGESAKTISVSTANNQILNRTKSLDIFLVEVTTNQENIDLSRDSVKVYLLDSEPNFSPTNDIADMYPNISSISDKGSHVKIESIEGEQIGLGLNYAYDQTNSNISLNKINNGISIVINGSNFPSIAGERWNIQIRNGNGGITVGSYLHAFSNPVFNSNEHKLDITGPSSSGFNRSSCTSTGSFRIFELIESNNEIKKISFDFELICEGSNTPLKGSLKYDDSLPDAIFPPLTIPTGIPSPVLPGLNSSGTVVELEGTLDSSNTPNQSLSFNNSNATFSVNTISNNEGVDIVINPNDTSSPRWFITLNRHNLNIYNLNNGRLAVGVYENATHFQTGKIGPGLGFSRSGLGGDCFDDIRGRFRVFEVSYDSSNNLEKLTADFERSCDNGPTSKGSIKYIR